MNRLDRLTSILIQLQSKRVITAQDLGERFSISLRTVYRDIRTLEEAGVPILGETGVGYSLMEGYRLPPVMFTKEEATAFLTAEKLIEKLTDSETEKNYKSALYKIKAVLRSSDKEYLEHLDEFIQVVDSAYLPKEKIKTNSIPLILKSIAEKQVLQMNYFANHSQENTSRKIEPVGILYLASYWHLVAYCHLRKDYRNFRLDRILEIRESGESFLQEHPSLKTFIKKISKEEAIHRVVMRVNKKMIPYLGDQKFYNGFISERVLHDQIEMTFLTASLEGFARWYLMFGDEAEISSPESLKVRIRQLAEQIQKKTKIIF